MDKTENNTKIKPPMCARSKLTKLGRRGCGGGFIFPQHYSSKANIEHKIKYVNWK